MNDNLLNATIKILSLINYELVITQSYLQHKLMISKEELDYICDKMIETGCLEYVDVSNERILSLTPQGKKKYDKKIRKMDFQPQFMKSVEDIEKLNLFNKYEVKKVATQDNIPSFIGCFIADKYGKTLLTFELFEGSLEYYLQGHIKKEEKMNKEMDIELIPMFVSALEKFSKEINIQDVSALKIKGANLKMLSYSYDKFTVTLFINPHINLKPIEAKVQDYFRVLFRTYKEELETSLKTGIMENISHLNELGREMLKELNKFVFLGEFKNIVNDLEYFDGVYARSLYSKLNNIYSDFELKFTIILEKIKKLKLNLLKAILEEDLPEFRHIINKTQDIQSKLSKI
ncbi:MAG: hypothetical protein GF353_06595 [Candidatus Lokiarchaeota archaeon]|nr:hypothetical protein [Candidatus Lokiarchaeota archaeon]